ncbi:MAG: class F sortase [Minisyncoccota bacterium]
MKIISRSAAALILLSIFAFSPLLAPKTTEASGIDYPTWVIAPSISLFSPVQGMGVTSKGELDVPSGYTNNVGWYKNGVLPGNTGTAVLDAHVFAAFKNLSLIQPGGEIYIFMASGKIHRYVVKESNYYTLENLSPIALFEPTNSKQLNLITCAGNYISSQGTYDHRLIVKAELV